MEALWVLAYLIVVNIWTAFRFWQDKERARDGERRIAESNLLGLALIGGTAGAFFGRAYFRHKTRKQPFTAQLYAIMVLQASVLGCLLFVSLEAR